MARTNSSFYVVLGILESGPKSGYDIKKESELEIGNYYKISNGQIYPSLKQLAMKGYATISVEKKDGKPDRKVYSISKNGRSAFKEWLMQPVDHSNPNGNELLLKLYFGAIAGTVHNSKLIAGLMNSKDCELVRYNDIARNFNLSTIRSAQEFYSYITLRYGQILTKAYIEWCNESIAILKKLESEPEAYD